MRTDDQNLMNFEKSVRENLLKTNQGTTNQTNTTDINLTYKGKQIPKLLVKKTGTEQLTETPERVTDHSFQHRMEQEIVQLKQQLEQKLSVDLMNAKPPTIPTYQVDTEELKSKKRLTANILSTIMKIQRTVDDVREFQTYFNLHDGEDSMNSLTNLEKESKQLRSNLFSVG